MSITTDIAILRIQPPSGESESSYNRGENERKRNEWKEALQRVITWMGTAETADIKVEAYAQTIREQAVRIGVMEATIAELQAATTASPIVLPAQVYFATLRQSLSKQLTDGFEMAVGDIVTFTIVPDPKEKPAEEDAESEPKGARK